MSVNTTHALAMRGNPRLFRCSSVLCQRRFSAVSPMPCQQRLLTTATMPGRVWPHRALAATLPTRSFSHSALRPAKGKSDKSDKSDSRRSKGASSTKRGGGGGGSSSSSSSASAGEYDEAAADASLPAADPENPTDMADVEARWQRTDTHYEQKISELVRSMGDGHGAVDVDAIGATPVKDGGHGGGGGGSSSTPSQPLSQLALILPRSGGRVIELRMHNAASRKAIISAIQSNPLFRGQQPQPDPDDELVLLLRTTPPPGAGAGADKDQDDGARRIRELANQWRTQIRHAAARRVKAHQTWKRDGSLLPDVFFRVERDLQNRQTKRLGRIDAAEAQALRGRNRGRK